MAYLFANPDDMEEGQSGNIVAEPGAAYTLGNTIYISPFQDKIFKKIFASETSKEVLRSFLNGVLQELPEKRDVKTITYGKNEYPGEIESEGGSAFDVVCTDSNGATFLVEVQQKRQEYFKERSLFYAGRLISDQAPKGVANWKYELKDIYVICLLSGFKLPDVDPDTYFHNIGLCDKQTGKLFYEKLDLIYLEVEKFNKQKGELASGLDEWLYALKHAPKINKVPDFFKVPEITDFFYLVKYSNLRKEERDMYRTQQQRQWDNQNVFDYAKKEARESGHEEGREAGLEAGLEAGREEERLKALAEKKEIAKNLKIKGVDLNVIAGATSFSIEEIVAL